MKKVRVNYIWMGLLGVCLLVTGCKKNKENGDGLKFRAVIEATPENSKTIIDPNLDEGKGYVKWCQNDKILISNGQTEATFSLTSGVGAESADFVSNSSSFTETGDYTAVYPRTATLSDGNSKMTFSMGPIQYIDRSKPGYADGINPMVAVSNELTLNFKNICGGIGFYLKGNGSADVTVEKVRITAKDTEEKLWGDFEVTNFANPVMTYTGSEGSNVLELAFENFVLPANPNDSVPFYFILPQGVLTQGFRIDVLIPNDETPVASRETSVSSATIVRNKIWLIKGGVVVPPEGSVPGDHPFSTDPDHKVYVSSGNLKYIPCEGKWYFFEEQYDYVGRRAGNNVTLANGRDTQCDPIDLFGWGTSGYDHGAVSYQPWANSSSANQYYAYGQPLMNLYEGTGYADWGKNPIFNGGDRENYGWRTMTMDEWKFMFGDRKNYVPSGHVFIKARIEHIPLETFALANPDVGTSGGTAFVNGLIMLPDDWSDDTYLYPITHEGSSRNYGFKPANYNKGGSNFTANYIDYQDWKEILEPAGVMFLPAAGDREGNTPSTQRTHGDYWSSSCTSAGSAREMYFYYTDSEGGHVGSTDNYSRAKGRSVRLVIDVAD